MNLNSKSKILNYLPHNRRSIPKKLYKFDKEACIR